MNPLGIVVSTVPALWAVAAAGMTGVALRQRRRKVTLALPTGGRPRVVLVRPCAGREPDLLHNLSSLLRARYTFDLTVIYTVVDQRDPAYEIATRAVERLRAAGARAEMRVARGGGENKKVAQLAAVVDPLLATPHDRPHGIVVVDSDVDLTGIDLDELASPLFTHTGVGATWLPPTERFPTTWGDRASAGVLGSSLHAFALLGAVDPGGLVGKTFAVRTDALRQVGGFAPLRDALGEDMALAARLKTRGWSCEMGTQVVPSRARGRTMAAALERYTRWLMVVRSERPLRLLAYPTLLAGFPIFAAWSIAGAVWVTPWALAAGALALLVRLAVSRIAAAISERTWSGASMLVECLLSDTLLLVACLRTLWCRRVRWRGRTLVLDQRGRLVARG